VRVLIDAAANSGSGAGGGPAPAARAVLSAAPRQVGAPRPLRRAACRQRNAVTGQMAVRVRLLAAMPVACWRLLAAVRRARGSGGARRRGGARNEQRQRVVGGAAGGGAVQCRLCAGPACAQHGCRGPRGGRGFGRQRGAAV